MAQRIAGIAFLKVDGNQYPLRGNFTVTPSVIERAGIAGQDYIHGYSELPRVPSIEGDVSTVPGLSIEDFDGRSMSRSRPSWPTIPLTCCAKAGVCRPLPSMPAMAWCA